jgi:hypothetical protein
MIKVNKYNVKIRTNETGKLVAELFCAIVSVLEVLYVNGEEEVLETVIKPELKEIIDCKTLEDFIKYQGKE